MDEMFNNLTRIIAHPHTAVTDHDRVRAARVMLTVNYYWEIGGFYDYATNVIDELDGKKR